MDTVLPLNVLLVEDNTSYRQGLTTLISTTPGMQCTACANAEQALALLEKDSWQVVVMDIDLPGMDGIQCTRQIKARWPQVQVLMCTVFEDDGKIFQALKAGATGYVVKQAPLGELLDAVRQVHAGGSPMSAGIARKVVNTFHQPAPNHEGLTQREQEMLQLIAEGLIVKEIADRTNVSTSTVRTHIRHIYEKLHVRSRVEAVNKLRGS
ncbi:MAG: response regulator transcription factor [Flavobacteriales bacterium]|nr:response regulator transcription factor [Flavobacteriales bacterium]MBL0036724.1 response regulator transcription factor [Flavobacteriales bacterium]